MRARELAADLRDLRGGFAVSEHDLGKPDAAQAIEVEREIRGHAAGSYPAAYPVRFPFPVSRFPFPGPGRPLRSPLSRRIVLPLRVL